MQVAALLTPRDFTSLTQTSSRLCALQDNVRLLQRVSANSQLVPPANVLIGKPAHRPLRAPGPALRAEVQLIDRLRQGPIVIDTITSSFVVQVAPSKLHVSSFDESAKRCTVLPLSPGSWPTLTVAIDEERWTFFGSAAFEFFAQQGPAGPLRLYDLSDETRARRCIAPQFAQGSIHARPVPQRSAYWVMCSGVGEMKLFEADLHGTFSEMRKIKVDARIKLRQCAWTGDLFTWESWRNNAIELIKLEQTGE